MPKTIIVWFRNDLRIHDHPALATAVADADHIVPVFIFSKTLLYGKHGSANRNRFLLECLQDLDSSLKSFGGALTIRYGKPEEVLNALAKDTGADAVYYSADYTPHAISRDKKVKSSLEADNIAFRSFSGRLIVSSLDKLHTKSGTDHKIFTPYYKNWLQIERRKLAETPNTISIPNSLEPGIIPPTEDLCDEKKLSPDALHGGETAALDRFNNFINSGLSTYKSGSNDMSIDATSRLSAYLHFGCISPLYIEQQLPSSDGAEAWRRQLCWREFYNYIIYKFPHNAEYEFQERYRAFPWGYDEKLLQAWKDGMTGYPIVDASMRQLSREGWMHNRGRLIVGSFLTKDLGLDWRLGERYFMQMLIDGDEANNNGNWQWIASVGVDPAPVFRRLYNPTLQQKNYDPTGAYVRRYVPELKNVPDKYLAEPWTMPPEIQTEAACVIGDQYPQPIVDHKEARLAALENYRNAAG